MLPINTNKVTLIAIAVGVPFNIIMENMFSLANNDFKEMGSRILHEMFLGQKFSDVTLVSSDMRTIQAHKSVLNIASDFFKDFFNVIKCEKPVVYLKDISHFQLEIIMKFIYLGQCEIPQEKIDEFVNAGQTLKLHSLIVDQENHENKPRGSLPTNEGVKNNENYDNLERLTKNSQVLEKEESMDEKNKQSVVAISEENSFIYLPGNFAVDTAKDSSGKYPCDQCDYKGPQKWNLARHTMGVHMKVKFPCDECEYKATQSSSLLRHKKTVHRQQNNIH